jgi:hypothetical protein
MRENGTPLGSTDSEISVTDGAPAAAGAPRGGPVVPRRSTTPEKKPMKFFNLSTSKDPKFTRSRCTGAPGRGGGGGGQSRRSRESDV